MQKEISELRAALEILSRCVEALGIAVGGPVGEPAGSESGYSVVDPSLVDRHCYQSAGRPEDRGQIYQDLADWLLRGVSGQRLGLSARDRLPGANRIHLLVLRERPSLGPLVPVRHTTLLKLSFWDSPLCQKPSVSVPLQGSSGPL